MNKASNNRDNYDQKRIVHFYFQCLFIFSSFLFTPFLTAQDNTLHDSLIQLLPTSKIDSHKVILLNDIAWELKFDDPQAARTYLDSALVLAQKLNYPKGEGNAYNYRGVVEDIHGNSELAIQYFQKALKIKAF